MDSDFLEPVDRNYDFHGKAPFCIQLEKRESPGQFVGVVCLDVKCLVPNFRDDGINDFGVCVYRGLAVAFSFAQKNVDFALYLDLVKKEKQSPFRGEFPESRKAEAKERYG